MLNRILVPIVLVLSIFSASCSSVIEPVTVEQKYDMAIHYIDKGSYGLATPLLEKIIEENPGTRYATYAYLKLGDAMMATGGDVNYESAKTNYKIFLQYSPTSPLVPYVLSRLIELNYKRNVSTIFAEDYAYSRDPEHFKEIIREYQRFFLLYPKSQYLKDARNYMEKSMEALAEHEFLIGNWYLKHSHYDSAIARYNYTLRNYPNFHRWEAVVQQLIKAYHKNQQPELADELQRVYEERIRL